MNTQTKYQTWLPKFNGFYGSNLEDDNDIEYILFDDPSIVAKEYLDWIIDEVYDCINYSDYQLALSQAICDCIGGELVEQIPAVKSVEFETLQSPKEYNFSNDSINIKIKCVYLDDIVKACLKCKDFAEYIHEKYTSYDGFMSHYENDVDKWLKTLDEDIAHKLGAMLEFLLDFDYMDLYDACSDICICEYIDYDKLLEAFNDEFETEFKHFTQIDGSYQTETEKHQIQIKF